MHITYQVVNSHLTFCFFGELDEHSATNLRGKIDAVITTELYSQVIFDLANLTFADSTGIGLFIGRYKLLAKNSIPLYITNPTPHIDKILTTSGLYSIMPKI